MSEIIIFYVLPNIALFGGIYVFAKFFEYVIWQGIMKMSNTDE